MRDKVKNNMWYAEEVNGEWCVYSVKGDVVIENLDQEMVEYIAELQESRVLQNRQEAYNAAGDMVTKYGQVFRQVGWQINGGVNDKFLVKNEDRRDIEKVLASAPHGGYSPVYVEVGTD